MECVRGGGTGTLPQVHEAQEKGEWEGPVKSEFARPRPRGSGVAPGAKTGRRGPGVTKKKGAILGERGEKKDFLECPR